MTPIDSSNTAPLKVLWFTNILMPDACEHLGRAPQAGSGWWMVGLLNRLKKRTDLRIAVVSVAGFRDGHFHSDGVEYFTLRQPLRRALLRRLRSSAAAAPSVAEIERYASIVRNWDPDIIHVHGTERDCGLIKAWGLTEKPVIISIQGLMGAYQRKAFGDLLPHEVRGSWLQRLTGVNSDTLLRWKLSRQHAPLEEQIIRSADLILGRTEWDYAWAWAIRPNLKYRRVDEIMRPEFLTADAWRLENCRRHQIFCTTGNTALKGLHVLLEAVLRLRSTYPNIAVTVASSGFETPPSNGYVRFIHNMIHREELQAAVTFLGWTDEEGLTKQLQRAHCYVMPSFVENSSNALQEAMLVGVPVVATACGGTPTIVDVGRTGLTFPPGDAAVLALRLHRMFQDDDLAVRLGAQARIIARERQDPERVEAQLMSAYREAMTAVFTSEVTHAHF